MKSKYVWGVIPFLIFIVFLNSYAQEPDSSYQPVYPKFDVHLGYGLANGGRIGVRYIANDHFSFELATGKDFRNFISASDEINKHSFGVNWHFDENHSLTSSFLIIYQKYTKLRNQEAKLFLSPTLSLINLKEPGFAPFVRLGFCVSIYEFEKESFGFNGFGLNLDVGLGWVFP